MTKCEVIYKTSLISRVLLVFCCSLILSGCRWVRVSTETVYPKQGDLLSIKINAGEKNEVDYVEYRIDGVGAGTVNSGTITSLPHYVSINTCKETGSYLYSLNVWAEATYNDGEKIVTNILRDGNHQSTSNLTLCENAREDGDRTYAIYIARDTNSEAEDMTIEMANAFMDEFDKYARSQYYWAEPRLYTNQSLYFTDSVDMAISFGHGNHHIYRAGNSSADEVDLSTTAFGGCATCYQTGDLEYLAFAACRVLSMNNSNGQPFWNFWFHEGSTRLDKRPFTGLHMLLGFRTNFVVTAWWLDNDGTDFFNTFAEYLDDNMKVIDAWLDAIADELTFDDGANRGAVVYHGIYENDRLSNSRGDYIYGNTQYSDQWITYWE